MLTGPELPNRSGGKAKQLILFLHGVGADGDNLIDLAQILSPHFPDAYFMSPNALDPYDMAPFGYQWFSLKDRSEQALLKGLNDATPRLNKFIDHQLIRFGLTDKDLAVIGFSQGCMLALHAFPRRPNPIALVAGLSGMLVAPSLLEKELKSKPSMLLLHGADDTVIPVSHMKPGAQTLKKLGFDLKTYIYPDLDHSIDQEEIEEIIKDLKTKFLIN
jgi:phospholipase/carboxylesterase